jgi:cyclic pyranopterin phosphate synthase
MTLALPAPTTSPTGVDRRGRALHDLRISVTDRCNFRCTYCMPRERFGPDHAFPPRRELLDVEEITRLARLFVDRGVRKIRLTGGELLLRRDLPAPGDRGADRHRVDHERLAAPAVRPHARRRGAAAGHDQPRLPRRRVFRRMTDSRFGVAEVLDGIDAAGSAGLGPVKINAEVRRSVNDSPGLAGLLDLAEHFRVPRLRMTGDPVAPVAAPMLDEIRRRVATRRCRRTGHGEGGEGVAAGPGPPPGSRAPSLRRCEERPTPCRDPGDLSW